MKIELFSIDPDLGVWDLTIDGKPLGWVDGNAGQVLNQAAGCLIAWSLAAVGTWIILKVCDAITGVRVATQDEIEGLDSGHG